MSSVVIGIPCYQNAPAETLADYMRWAYSLGRRSKHDYFLGVKAKSEQFRARNAIVENFLQIGADYLLMVDDDHVIDWDGVPGPHTRYLFADRWIEEFEAHNDVGIIGGLYYQRGSDCKPVAMKLGNDGGYYWLRDDQIVPGFNDVAVTGGGCFMFRKGVFDRIPSPWFEPELDMGTDLQICTKTTAEGFRVLLDAETVLGHVKTERLVVTPKNRSFLAIESHQKGVQELSPQGMESTWVTQSALQLYEMDAEEYLGKPLEDCRGEVDAYLLAAPAGMAEHAEDPRGYYASLGTEQLIRQAWFHSLPRTVEQAKMWHSMINVSVDACGCDVGCGSAPVVFDLLMRSNHHIDFIDIDGAGAYELLKWRVKKRGVEAQAGWAWGGPYDYVFALDAIEHWKDWQGMLLEITSRLKTKGAFMTNFFKNLDFNNPEHIAMDHAAVRTFLAEQGVFPLNDFLFVKQDLAFMDRADAVASVA